VKSSGEISAELLGGQIIEEHVVTGLDILNGKNRLSLTSGAVAEEPQEVSSKSRIDEIAGAISLSLEAKIVVSSQLIYQKKYRNIGWKMTQVLFDIVMKSYF